MSRLIQLFQNLKTSDEDDGGELLYTDVVEALKGARVTDLEILQQLKNVVLADIAVGVATYLEHGGPQNPSTLQLEHGLDAVKLLIAVQEAQERSLTLRPYLEGIDPWAHARPTSGSISPESESSRKS